MGRLEVGVLGTAVWVIEEWVRAVQVIKVWATVAQVMAAQVIAMWDTGELFINAFQIKGTGRLGGWEGRESQGIQIAT
ncbi:hypothetical protein MCJ35_30445 [Enterocloster sp. OA13]|uniref:hypothetical protein n=1 Tax=Enterocloster sp. OA13 TaxID=2914161 RepID=UPI0012DC39D3|nr:hypothetical protein [Enterocloster sp. OA13]